MNTKQIISIFTFGVFLIIIGAVGKILKWQQASIILATGMVFELFAALAYVWNKLKNK